MNVRSALAVLASGCLWGCMGLFVRRFDSYDLPSMSIVAIRSFFTALILFAALLIFDRSLLRIRIKDLWIFAGCGIASLVFFNFCYFKAITLMSMSMAAILLYTSPVFVTLFSALIFKERITLRKTFAILLSLCGLVFVTGVFSDTGSVSAAGILIGLGSAVGYALYSIFSRFAIERGYSAWTITFYPFVFASAVSMVISDLKPAAEMFTEDPPMIGFSVLFALAVSVLPYALYSWGLKGMENSRAAVIASVEPVTATILGIAVYGEDLSVSLTVGIVLVLAGIILSIEKNPCRTSGVPLED